MRDMGHGLGAGGRTNRPLSDDMGHNGNVMGGRQQ